MLMLFGMSFPAPAGCSRARLLQRRASAFLGFWVRPLLQTSAAESAPRQLASLTDRIASGRAAFSLPITVVRQAKLARFNG
jgi:hypothetical protein